MVRKKYPKNKTIRLLEQLFNAKTDVVKITIGKDEKCKSLDGRENRS